MTALDRIGSVGAVIAAIAAPCCLPIFASLAGALGITALGLNDSVVFYTLQAFALLSVIGLLLAARRHRSVIPVALGIISAAALFFAFYGMFSAPVVYLGLAGLCAASVWNYLISRKVKRHEADVTLKSVITCPRCGYRAKETMPTNACLFFYDCPACGPKLKPTPGDCYVFCIYESVPRPPIQHGGASCV